MDKSKKNKFTNKSICALNINEEFTFLSGEHLSNLSQMKLLIESKRQIYFYTVSM